MGGGSFVATGGPGVDAVGTPRAVQALMQQLGWDVDDPTGLVQCLAKVVALRDLRHGPSGKPTDGVFRISRGFHRFCESAKRVRVGVLTT